MSDDPIDADRLATSCLSSNWAAGIPCTSNAPTSPPFAMPFSPSSGGWGIWNLVTDVRFSKRIGRMADMDIALDRKMEGPNG